MHPGFGGFVGGKPGQTGGSACPGVPGQFVARQDPHQAIRRMRVRRIAKEPVTHGALGDVKNFPDIGQLQAGLQAQGFEPQPSIGADLRSCRAN